MRNLKVEHLQIVPRVYHYIFFLNKIVFFAHGWVLEKHTTGHNPLCAWCQLSGAGRIIQSYLLSAMQECVHENHLLQHPKLLSPWLSSRYLSKSKKHPLKSREVWGNSFPFLPAFLPTCSAAKPSGCRSRGPPASAWKRHQEDSFRVIFSQNVRI